VDIIGDDESESMQVVLSRSSRITANNNVNHLNREKESIGIASCSNGGGGRM